MSSVPTARPVPADAAIESAGSRDWAPTLALVVGAWVVTALLWLVTSADVFYGFVVAATAAGSLRQGPVTWRRARVDLSAAALVAIVGALTLGHVGIGLSVQQRIVQGAGGVIAAALVLFLVSLVQRRRMRRVR